MKYFLTSLAIFYTLGIDLEYNLIAILFINSHFTKFR